MARRTQISDRMTLAIRLSDGSRVTVDASANAMRFIGRYSRISAFGPIGARISAQIVTRD